MIKLYFKSVDYINGPADVMDDLMGFLMFYCHPSPARNRIPLAKVKTVLMDEEVYWADEEARQLSRSGDYL